MSAVDTRAVPCNLLAWPAISNLLPDQKLIGAYLFFSPDASACGCYFLPRPPAAADLSLPVAVLEEALREFERRKLVALDNETGEIFVLSWPRWLNFRTPSARGALWTSLDRIKSRKLSTIAKSAYKSIPRPGKGVGVGVVFPFTKEIGQTLPPGWWESDEGVMAAGRLLKLNALPGESMGAFKARIRAAVDRQHQKKSDPQHRGPDRGRT